ncbi:MFS transporter [Roseateles oligotrophus]|uniref:MFS transporter n=1 Tax=Roseateles oligotrophus TaxID=1769250 RepID=A0ABT2YI69_9BURK|nr:MFS transporter [Roseateles oligotrophus]MCV2369741.1 MFS transporter [Roseateles oligotrophus]
MQTSHPHPAPIGMLSPLRHPEFRQLCLANFASNLGNAMQSYALLCLIMAKSKTPLSAALLQTAGSAPMLIFALLAGSLAERIERARLQFWINTVMALSAAAVALAALQGKPGETTVLLLTFLMGSGAALLWPAWQTSVASLLPAEQLPAAASLNNMSFNSAALLGPALGAALLHGLGASAVLAVNALSFLGLLTLYRRWSRTGTLGEPASKAARRARTWRAGGQAAPLQSGFKRLLGLVGCIFFGTIGLVALLPAYASKHLRLDATVFAGLLAMLGLGAVLSAFILPPLRARFGPARLLSAALAGFAGLLTLLPHVSALGAHLLIALGGMAMATLITTLNSLLQARLHPDARASGLGSYMLILAAGQTLGSLAWGLAADRWGVTPAWLAASTLLLLCAAAVSASADRTARNFFGQFQLKTSP